MIKIKPQPDSEPHVVDICEAPSSLGSSPGFCWWVHSRRLPLTPAKEGLQVLASPSRPAPRDTSSSTRCQLRLRTAPHTPACLLAGTDVPPDMLGPGGHGLSGWCWARGECVIWVKNTQRRRI